MKNNVKRASAVNFEQVKNVKADIESILNYFILNHPNASESDLLYFLNQYLLSQGKLQSSYAYSMLIDFDRYEKYRILNLLKNFLKKIQRSYVKFILKSIIDNSTVCILGPSKQCLEDLKNSDILILLKLYHSDHLKNYKTKKLILIWNGSACDRYLANQNTLPSNVLCILAKTDRAGINIIRSVNPRIKVLQYKTLNKAKWGEQTIIVDAIELFSGITKTQINLTGFDLRVSSYRKDYQAIYEVHGQIDNMLKTFYNGHAPYSDFFLISKYFRQGIINPDDKLKEILNLSVDEYLAMLEGHLNL